MIHHKIDIKNVLFSCNFGSHLYGTATESSDVDIKGVYKAEMRDVILNRAVNTYTQSTKKDTSEKNSKEDIDVEYKELRYFLKEASDGQTYALDMLFCPPELTTQTSEIWKEIQKNRLKIISKQCKPILGYIHQQCAKYAVKGSRLNALQEVIAWAQTKPSEAKIVEHLEDFPERMQIVDGETVYFTKKEWIVEGHRNGQPYADKMINVLGMCFQYGAKFKYIYPVLNKRNDEFGQRAILAQKNQGVDWKAVSHAVRLILQAKELAATGNIIFPLTQKDFLLEIKRGERDWTEVNRWIADHIDQVFGEIKKSPYLLDKPDQKWIDEFIISHYL